MEDKHRRITIGPDGEQVKPSFGKKDQMTDFSAAEAKALVEKYRTEGDDELKVILARVLKSVREGAIKGERSQSFAGSIYGRHGDGLVVLLKARGFDVKVMHDQRDGDYITVKF